ncbi:MAG: anti-sigma factor antagonist, partial [Planctomycetales bacterium]
MEFTDDSLEVCGTLLVESRVENNLGFKTPLVYRILKVLQQNGYLPDYGFQMAELCLEEAIANAMIHGNQLDKSKSIDVHVFADGDNFGIIIGDEGEGFGPEDLPDMNNPEHLLRERGRGIMIIDHYMDEVRYNRDGRRICMRRQRQRDPDPGAQPPPEPRLPKRVPDDGQIEPVEVKLGDVRPAVVETVVVPDEIDIEQPSDPLIVERIGPLVIRHLDQVVVAKIEQRRIAEENAQPLREALEEIVGNSENLVLDFSEVDFMASVGISTIVVARKRIAARKGRLVLCNLQPAVQSVFEIMGLHKLIPILADADSAIEKI